MIDVIIPAVNIRNTGNLLTGTGPHLRHIRHCRSRRTGNQTVPDNDLPSLSPDIGCHRFQEIRISDSYFITSNMNIGCLRKSTDHLIKNIFQSGYSLISLHIKPHSLAESVTMSRHIYFRNNCYATFCRIILQFATFFLSVITSRITDHILGSRKLWISFHLKSPGQLFRQMPMKHIDFKTGKQIYLLFQFFYTDK